jgi:aryl-alcohol dehydrogenase-like predicted oxidoreductase
VTEPVTQSCTRPEPWSLAADASRDIIKQALDGGVNFLDTANGYSAGSSEEIVGQAVKDFTRREEVVLSTKVWMRIRPGPNGAGLSRKAIFAELDASLKRLGTDYIDLYQIHRWGYDTPIEETLEALHDAVKSGKVRYIGVSSMYAWQFAKALYLADLNGWTGSCRCRTTTTSSTGRQSGRCSLSAPTRASA